MDLIDESTLEETLISIFLKTIRLFFGGPSFYPSSEDEDIPLPPPKEEKPTLRSEREVEWGG